MNEFACKAILHYDIQVIGIEQINNDGDVFLLISPDGNNYFLKIIDEKKGTDYIYTENLYHTYEQLCIEMQILNTLKNTMAKTAYPVSNKQGDYVSRLDDSVKVCKTGNTVGTPPCDISCAICAPTAHGDSMYATVTSYIDGVNMEEAKDEPCEMAYAAGIAAARLHENSPNNLAIKRPHRDKAYIRKIMGRIREGVDVYKTISELEYTKMKTGLEHIMFCMDELDKDSGRNKGLVHTDLRCGNFIYSDGSAIPIDFTRSVYGYFLYDLGEMCAHMGGMAPDYKAQSEIIRGYSSIRPLSLVDKQMVQAFFTMFLLILIAECIEQKDSLWFSDTVQKLCDLYIPSVQKNELFINMR